MTEKRNHVTRVYAHPRDPRIAVIDVLDERGRTTGTYNRPREGWPPRGEVILVKR